MNIPPYRMGCILWKDFPPEETPFLVEYAISGKAAHSEAEDGFQASRHTLALAGIALQAKIER